MINCTAMQLAGWVVQCSRPHCSSSEAICELWLNCHFQTLESIYKRLHQVTRGHFKTLLFNIMKTSSTVIFVLHNRDKKHISCSTAAVQTEVHSDMCELSASRTNWEQHPANIGYFKGSSSTGSFQGSLWLALNRRRSAINPVSMLTTR